VKGGARLRGAFRRLHRQAMARLSTRLGAEALRQPAMVFAPHPDDETLGCGGTLLRKRQVGAEVRLVFLTDGAASHPHPHPRAGLAALRAREALAAAEALGVSAEHVAWLGFPDGALAGHHAAAVSQVEALLERHRPEQLFVPSAWGEHADHAATCAIVYEALRRALRRATVLEYPVWRWRHWPTTSMTSSPRRRLAALSSGLAAGFGLRLLAEFRTSVPIRGLLGQKRAALARHASQLQRREGEPGGEPLGEVDGGEFLDCFFQDHEVYRRVEVEPGR